MQLLCTKYNLTFAENALILLLPLLPHQALLYAQKEVGCGVWAGNVDKGVQLKEVDMTYSNCANTSGLFVRSQIWEPYLRFFFTRIF